MCKKSQQKKNIQRLGNGTVSEKKLFRDYCGGTQNFVLFMSVISDRAMDEKKLFKPCVYLFIFNQYNILKQ